MKRVCSFSYSDLRSHKEYIAFLSEIFAKHDLVVTERSSSCRALWSATALEEVYAQFCNSREYASGYRPLSTGFVSMLTAKVSISIDNYARDDGLVSARLQYCSDNAYPAVDEAMLLSQKAIFVGGVMIVEGSDSSTVGGIYSAFLEYASQGVSPRRHCSL